ncbi:MAG TPA: acyltransferase family protein [Agitococcus sp.]|nr:acyltransferase family protein [Agitococcus sp.]
MNYQKQHLGGLDGLRAVAVLAVILYHLNLSNFFSGGFLGVDIFFTLSGFLITSLLLKEYEKTQTIDLKIFYVRRMKRLLPAMLGVIVICSALVPFVAQDAVFQLRKDIPAALLYYSNWWQIVSEQSYFEMMNRPPLLQHLWSLAIEEQFYVFWPLLVLIIVRYGHARWLLWFASSLMLISAACMGFLAIHNDIPLEADPNRLYLGTDTHTSGLFAGAMLAYLWNPWRINFQSQKAYLPVVFSLLGVCGLLVLCALFTWANETQAWLYRGGFLGVAFATVFVIIGATYRGGYLEKALSIPIMRYLGERSYGLYLWHWPIFVLIRPQDFIINEWLTQGLRLIVTLFAAELSYRYIETPLRFDHIHTLQRPKQWQWLGISAASIMAVVVLYQQPVPMFTTTTEIISHEPVIMTTPNALASPAKIEVITPPHMVTGPIELTHMLAIGDSVMLGAADYLKRGVAGISVDAAVGRQGRDAIKLIRQLKADGKLPARLLIHMGTNGYLPVSQFKQLITDLSDREEIVLINIQANRRWMGDNNDLLNTFKTESFKNVKVIDWAANSATHRDYFVADGIHLSTKGIYAYVDLIRKNLGISGAFLSHAELKHMAKTIDKNTQKHTQTNEDKQKTTDSNSKIAQQTIISSSPNTTPHAIPPIASIDDKQEQVLPKHDNLPIKIEETQPTMPNELQIPVPEATPSIDTKAEKSVIIPLSDESKTSVDNIP